jgi:hypothetical protein
MDSISLFGSVQTCTAFLESSFQTDCCINHLFRWETNYDLTFIHLIWRRTEKWYCRHQNHWQSLLSYSLSLSLSLSFSCWSTHCGSSFPSTKEGKRNASGLRNQCNIIHHRRHQIQCRIKIELQSWGRWYLPLSLISPFTWTVVLQLGWWEGCLLLICESSSSYSVGSFIISCVIALYHDQWKKANRRQSQMKGTINVVGSEVSKKLTEGIMDKICKSNARRRLKRGGKISKMLCRVEK